MNCRRRRRPRGDDRVPAYRIVFWALDSHQDGSLMVLRIGRACFMWHGGPRLPGTVKGGWVTAMWVTWTC